MVDSDDIVVTLAPGRHVEAVQVRSGIGPDEARFDQALSAIETRPRSEGQVAAEAVR